MVAGADYSYSKQYGGKILLDVTLICVLLKENKLDERRLTAYSRTITTNLRIEFVAIHKEMYISRVSDHFVR